MVRFPSQRCTVCFGLACMCLIRAAHPHMRHACAHVTFRFDSKFRSQRATVRDVKSVKRSDDCDVRPSFDCAEPKLSLRVALTFVDTKVSIANQVMMERLQVSEAQVEVTRQLIRQQPRTRGQRVGAKSSTSAKLLTPQSPQHGCRDLSRHSEYLQLSAQTVQNR